MNAYEEMLAGYADLDAGYPDDDPDALNLNTSYADTDADSCIRIMSLCCTIHFWLNMNTIGSLKH